jgi:nitroreductase
MTRRFDPTPLAVELIDELLECARRAPSAGYSQGTHFLVLSGDAVPAFWNAIGAAEWFDDGVLRAPHIVLPLADGDTYTARYGETDKAGHGLDQRDGWPVPYWLTDTAMATQNLLLLAEERGIGALLFGIFRNERQLLDALGVPATVQSIGAVALGHRAADDVPSGSPRTRVRRSPADVIHHQRWSAV